VIAFWVLRLSCVAVWLWLEFQHIKVKEMTVKQTAAKKQCPSIAVQRNRTTAKKSMKEDARYPSFFNFFSGA
jgi:hypothetical protein